MPTPPVLVQPRADKHYGYYHFRFQSVRADGSRPTHSTKVTDLTEAGARSQVEALLGDSGRYELVFLGLEEIPKSQWPLRHLISCGFESLAKAKAPKPSSAVSVSPPPGGSAERNTGAEFCAG